MSWFSKLSSGLQALTAARTRTEQTTLVNTPATPPWHTATFVNTASQNHAAMSHVVTRATGTAVYEPTPATRLQEQDSKPQQQESWIDSLKRYLANLAKPLTDAVNGGPSPEEAPPRPRGPLSLPGEQQVVERHAEMVGKGMDITLGALEVMDMSGGGVGALRSYAKGDNTGIVIGMAGMIGGPALSEIFGVSKSALTTGRLLTGQLGEAKVYAQFTTSGRTRVADIIGTYGAKEQGLGTTTRALFKHLIAFAKQEGAQNVRVQAVGVINKELEQKLVKQGFEKTTVWVEGFGNTPAYAKTFRLKK